MSFPTRTLRPGEPEWPELLALAPDQPALLYVQGSLPPRGRRLAVVGTREPSRFSLEVVRRIVPLLVARGWSIVSGLARGIDAAAHRAALDARGHTVAVLGDGLARIHPSGHVDLAREILDAGGALVSEQPDDDPVSAQHLVARNRIQSGLSTAVLVAGAGLVSGTMHTVRFALRQERLVLAPVPPAAWAGARDSEATLALTGLAGPALADRLEARGIWARLLRWQFAARPVALAIRGRDDYERVFAALEAHEAKLKGA